MATGGPLVADVFTAIARETLDGRNAQLADGGRVATMQSINRVVCCSVFMAQFLGLTTVSVGQVALGVIGGDGEAGWAMAIARVAAGAIYPLGCVGVTALTNVPMNTALASLDGEAARACWR